MLASCNYIRGSSQNLSTAIFLFINFHSGIKILSKKKLLCSYILGTTGKKPVILIKLQIKMLRTTDRN